MIDDASKQTVLCAFAVPLAETKVMPVVRRRRTLPPSKLTRSDRVPVHRVAIAPRPHFPPLWLMMLLLALMSGSAVLSALRPQLPMGIAQQAVSLVSR